MRFFLVFLALHAVEECSAWSPSWPSFENTLSPLRSTTTEEETDSRALNTYNKNPLFAGFDDLFAPTPFFRRDPIFDHMLIFPNLERPTDSVLVRSSPGYEINETDDTYQIAVDVPGVKAGDMSVQLENDGKVLRISGGRKVVKDNMTTETKFEKRFTIGKNVDMEKVTANLVDGVLVLSAPKIETKEEPVVNITITEGLLEEKTEAKTA
jgi:HSP20 family protein